MRHMGWSWAEWQATPPYVRTFCRDFMYAEMRARPNG